MKTEYQVRNLAGIALWPWSSLNSVKSAFYQRTPANTLWRRQTETTEEAAVRRMKWLEDMADSSGSFEVLRGVSLTAHIDAKCPPPAATETQVNWDTLEPVNEVPVWKFVGGQWLAGIPMEKWHGIRQVDVYKYMRDGEFAIGHTRESALRNLAELQSIRK